MLKLLLGIAVLIALLGAAITRDKMLAREANGGYSEAYTRDTRLEAVMRCTRIGRNVNDDET
jgi:hypothetical protein